MHRSEAGLVYLGRQYTMGEDTIRNSENPSMMLCFKF